MLLWSDGDRGSVAAVPFRLLKTSMRIALVYTNLLFFLAAIFLFSMERVSETPLLSGRLSLALFILTVAVYTAVARLLFGKRAAAHSAGYFSTEKKLSFLALAAFSLVLFVGDAKYYLSVLSLDNRVPAFTNIAGLGLFLLFFMLMWLSARRSYERVFGRSYTPAGFVLANIKANLPIVLPWIVLSLLSDAVTLLPWPDLQGVIRSEWGDLVFFGSFLVFVLLFFPPLVRWLWGCKRLPDGELRDRLIAFCREQHFFSEIYLWPLFEGRVLTAGVMGLVPGLRYILITPALIETLSPQELEAVVAHELGHVKKMHLLLYFFLIGGFSILAGYFAEPVTSFFLSRDLLYTVIAMGYFSPETLLTLAGGLPLLILMLLYFRYLFGYFLRNFERQADLEVFPVLGNSQALISAFEKIATLSGDIRNKPSWHHFGIGERVAFLEKCEADPSWIRRHTRKVRLSLVAYVLTCVAGIMLAKQLPTDQFTQKYQEMYSEAMVLQQVKREPDKAIWLRLLGDMMAKKKMDAQALDAYSKALVLEPLDAEVMNNLAWLYLTTEDSGLRNPVRALNLARSAALIQPKGFVLDTLAMAYWANGFVTEAVAAEKEAAKTDPADESYYLGQIDKFINQTYKQAMQNPPPDDANQARTGKMPSGGGGT
jgi:Zn-dependent protease with chaperone function